VPVLTYIVLRVYKDKKPDITLGKPLMAIVSITIITAILTVIPILTLSKNSEFKWGVISLMESFKSFIFNSSYGRLYAFNDYFVVGLVIMMLLYSSIKCILFYKDTNSVRSHPLYFIAVTSFPILIAIMMISKSIGDTFFPVDRKTILYLPWGAIMTAFAIDAMHPKVAKIASSILALVFMLHLMLAWRHNEVREWWYDRDTKDFVAQASKDCDQPPCEIGTAWFFHPTTNFYTKHYHAQTLKVGDYNKDLVSQPNYDYFICFTSDYPAIADRYDILYQNIEGRMLLRRKSQ
jgi:hypothetical protein